MAVQEAKNKHLLKSYFLLIVADILYHKYSELAFIFYYFFEKKSNLYRAAQTTNI